MMTGAAGAAALAMLICIISVRIRVRRERQKFREQTANQIARTQAAESANAAKAEFLASMSHRIRTPLTAIVGFTELALETELAPQLREYLDTVRTSADWLMDAVNDILEFSRIEAGTLELENVPFSISECILSAMKIVEPEAAAKKLKTACKIDPRLPQVVCGDPARLRHVIFNLLDNAVRSTTRGSIMLSTVLESNGTDDILVRVAVTDTGIGIPPVKQPLIFQPFHTDETATVKSPATALGLPISRRLVELMGGTINIQSQLGAGSTFEFTARFQKQKAAELEASVRAPESAGRRELSILVVDDDAVNRRLLVKVLESAGHRVWAAENGSEALHYVQTEAFDFIFMDLEMPDLDGLEATRAIRKDEAPGLHVPIYALTAHALPRDRDRCLAAGMDGFLTKPIAVAEVLQLLSKVEPGTACISGPDLALDPADKGPGTGIISAAEIAPRGTDARDAAADSSEKLALQAIWRDPSDIAVDAADNSHASEPDPASAEDLHYEEAQKLDPSVCLSATAPAPQVSDPSGAPANSHDGGPNPGTRLSASLGLALLDASCASRRESSSLAEQGDSQTPGAAWDPFEQARKALCNSRFDVRVIHNNGDPSDRNLI
jgi:signal transduction histidine kinase/ActR/RegA family two-component response regulator